MIRDQKETSGSISHAGQRRSDALGLCHPYLASQQQLTILQEVAAHLHGEATWSLTSALRRTVAAVMCTAGDHMETVGHYTVCEQLPSQVIPPKAQHPPYPQSCAAEFFVFPIVLRRPWISHDPKWFGWGCLSRSRQMPLA